MIPIVKSPSLIQERNGFQLHPEYGTEPSVYYIDGKIGNAPSNMAPREVQTASHMQRLSSQEEKAKQVFRAEEGRR